MAWMGDISAVQNYLSVVRADRGADGRFIIGGEPVGTGLDPREVVVPDGTVYFVEGAPKNLAAGLSSTSGGVGGLKVYDEDPIGYRANPSTIKIKRRKSPKQVTYDDVRPGMVVRTREDFYDDGVSGHGGLALASGEYVVVIHDLDGETLLQEIDFASGQLRPGTWDPNSYALTTGHGATSEGAPFPGGRGEPREYTLLGETSQAELQRIEEAHTAAVRAHLDRNPGDDRHEEQIGTFHVQVFTQGPGSVRFIVTDDATGSTWAGAQPGQLSDGVAAARRIVMRQRNPASVESLEIYTLEQLEAMPSMSSGHWHELKAEAKVRGVPTRWWLSRMSPADGEQYQVHVEQMLPRVGWQNVHSYAPYDRRASNPSPAVHRAHYWDYVEAAKKNVRMGIDGLKRDDMAMAWEGVRRAECDVRQAYTEASYATRDPAELRRLSDKLVPLHEEIREIMGELRQARKAR